MSWWTYLSYSSGMVACTMAKTSYSGGMAWDDKEAILAVPGAEIADVVLGCASTTGFTTDKAAKFGIELAEVEGSPIKILAHSRVAIVCDLKEHHEVAIITSISATWSRFVGTRARRPCSRGTATPRFALLNKGKQNGRLRLVADYHLVRS